MKKENKTQTKPNRKKTHTDDRETTERRAGRDMHTCALGKKKKKKKKT